MKSKPKVPFCPNCGDRIVFTVPNEAFRKLVLENGYLHPAGYRYIEINEPFVLTILSDEGEKNIFGEPGSKITLCLITGDWGVAWE